MKLQKSSAEAQEEVSLYFHIPFCTKKCHYCHFYVLPDKLPLKISLMEGLKLEWESQRLLLKEKKITTIYFGGGTPYLLGAKMIGEILQWIAESHSLSPNIEITLEANPEDVSFETMQAYCGQGINRVSIGIQSFNTPHLISLGRLHTANKGVQAVEIAAKAGINNISIDLMYDLPDQTLESWRHTIERVNDLPISHLSLYNLTIEPHTIFFKLKDKLEKTLPNQETSLAMYEMAVQELQRFGLNQYEISAFARNEQFSRHNVGYWIGRPFLGFGPSAFSYWQGRRFQNIANLSKYVKRLQTGLSPVDFTEKLDPEAKLKELLTIQMRLMQGVNLDEFERQFGQLPKETFAALDDLTRLGYVVWSDRLIKLTKQGVLFYDSIAAELI